MQDSALWGWIGPLVVTVFGAILRFHRLGEPKAVVFDETFYIKDAYSLITYGAERKMLGDAKNPIADRNLIAGNLDIFQKCQTVPDCASYVAHPPLGKWMIGAGEWIFGMDSFGWRFAAAFVGVLSILILARVARRMTRSTLLGCLAGLLLALDGLHFVLSRTALLDIFLMFWVLAGFACLVVDRDRMRERLADWYETSPLTPEGPWLGLRPWRIAGGLCLGAAIAVKWSGIFFLIAFAVLTLVWDAGARRAIGLRRPYVGTFTHDLPTAFGALAFAPVAVLMASWTGWFATDKGWGRKWEQATSNDSPVFFAFDSLRSWVDYQVQVLGFHSQLTDSHPYQSQPWQWPLLGRPISFHYPEVPPSACGADKCSQAVLAVGTPALWFGAALAMFGLIVWYVATRDWRAGAVLLAYAAGWLPWVYYALANKRTMYFFYMIPIVPFMVLAVVLMAGLALGAQNSSPLRRGAGAAAVGAFSLVVVINFWWLYPVLSAETITQSQWWARMLFRSWV